MPRRPKSKDGLTAGERVRLYEAEQEKRLSANNASADGSNIVAKAQETERAVAKVKRELPRPQHAVVNVDLSLKIGKIKAMHGVMNGPLSHGADLSDVFKEIGVPYVRFGGAEMGSDIDLLFKTWGADDHGDVSIELPETDEWVAAARATGAGVIFKLGMSRDVIARSEIKYPCVPADDLVRICLKIVKRYYDRGVGGVRGFEVSDICETEHLREVYCRVAESIKLYDEDILVGTRVSSALSADDKELLKYCKKNHIPLDFVTVDCFGESVEDDAAQIEKVSAYLRNIGHDETRIVVGALSYAPLKSAECGEMPLLFTNRCLPEARKHFFDKRRQTEGAAYLGAMMIRLGEIEGVSAACAYDCRPYLSPWCPVTDTYGNKEKPFYLYQTYGKLYRTADAALCQCEQTAGMKHTGIYATAAVGEKEAYCLIVSFAGCSVVDLRLDGIPDDLYSAEVYMLDGVKNMSLADTVALSGMKKRLLLNVSNYGAVLVRLY